MGNPAGAGRAQKHFPRKVSKASSLGSNCGGGADRGVSVLSADGGIAGFK